MDESYFSVYIYRMRRPWNLYYTFVISAFWHGFYPGYYLFFVTMSVVTSIHRKVGIHLHTRFLVCVCVYI